MKVAILGSYPSMPYHSRLKFTIGRRLNVTTYWNYNLVKALARYTKVEVHFFTYGPVPYTQILKDESAFIHFVGHPPKISLLDQRIGFRIICRHFHQLIRKLNPDLVYGIGTDHAYAHVAQTSGYPYLIKIGGLMGQIVERVDYPHLRRYSVLSKLEMKIVRQAHNIIIPRKFIKYYYDSITSAEWHIVQNPIDLKQFDIKKSEIYDLIYAGKIYKLKRLLNLVMAVGKLVEKGIRPKVIVAGGTLEKGYLKKIQNYITDKGIQELFQFTGPLAQSDLIDIIAKTKLMIVPSFQETESMVALEAMALGKPVIASNVGGLSETIDDRLTGVLVPPDDIEALAEAIGSLLDNNAERVRIGRAARKSVAQNYDPEMVALSNLRVFEKVLARYRLCRPMPCLES